MTAITENSRRADASKTRVPSEAGPPQVQGAHPLGEGRQRRLEELAAEAIEERSPLSANLTLSATDLLELSAIIQRVVREAAEHSTTLPELQELIPSLLVLLQLDRQAERLLRLREALSRWNLQAGDPPKRPLSALEGEERPV